MVNKIKKLRLKPSQIESRRYFIVSSTKEDVEKAIKDYIGILGFAKSSYMAVEYKKSKDKLIGSCSSKYLEDIRASLAFKKIKIEKVSGTLKGLFR